MKKMKKVLFLMSLLFLIDLGTAGLKAQVRIGGNTPPNPAAALDLNAAEGTTTGTKGLALPRVTLGSSTAPLDGTTANITGMLVYNTGGSLSTGVYYWSGTNWNRVDGAALGGDTIVGNEVVNATTGRGLVLAGSGTTSSPYTLGIARAGVDTSMLAPPPWGPAIIAWSGGAWRTAHYQTIYNRAHYNVSPGTYVYDTIDWGHCLTTPVINQIFVSGTTTISISAWHNMDPFVVVSTVDRTGTAQVTLSCWRSDF